MHSPTTVVLILLAGALGALVRIATLRLATRRGYRSSLGLVVLNLGGSFLAGVAAAVAAGTGVEPRIATIVLGGLLGGYTTFSAVSLEVATARGGQRRWVSVEAVLSVLAAPPIALVGMRLGALLVASAGGTS